MTSTSDWFNRCNTTIEVHNELRKLLICEYLKMDDARERFRLNCRSTLSHEMRQEQSIEKILDYLEDNGNFNEGNYVFIKQKVDDVDVAITYLIKQAESRIKEIRENALLVSIYVTGVEPANLERETREKVDAILLAVSEFIICRQNEQNTNVSGLWNRFGILQTMSNEFLHIWHGCFCKCRKYFGQKMLLRFLASGAIHLSRGESEFDHFKNNVFPYLETTLRQSAENIYHVFKDCGASPVSAVSSSVLSYWIFDSVHNLDKFWKRYCKTEFNAGLRKFFSSKEALSLLKADRISIMIKIELSDYRKYRSRLVSLGQKVKTTLSYLILMPDLHYLLDDMFYGGSSMSADLKRMSDLARFRFKETVGHQTPMNVIVIGTAGVGKSSFLNTVMTSLSDTRYWVERASIGNYQETGKQKPYHLNSFKKDRYITNLNEKRFAYPTLLDIAGLEDEDSLLIQEMLRVVLFGRLHEGESLQDLQRFISQNLHDINIIRNKYSNVKEKHKVDRIIFIASAHCNTSIPTKLIEAVHNASHSSEMVIPQYGVLTHCDLVDVGREEFLRKEKDFKSHLGLPDNRFLRCRNYCDDIDRIYGTNRLEEAIPQIDIPVIIFMTQVCDPGLTTPDTEAAYHRPTFRIDPVSIFIAIIIAILAIIIGSLLTMRSSSSL